MPGRKAKENITVNFQQTEGVMNCYFVRTAAVSLLGLSVIAALVVAAQQQEKPVDNKAEQIKALQKERIDALQTLVSIYRDRLLKGGLGGESSFERYISASEELLNAQLEAAEKPKDRVALLKKHLQLAEDVLRRSEVRAAGGDSVPGDQYRSKARYLEIKIKLLREDAAQQPQAK
jgi:hypothetical protein